MCKFIINKDALEELAQKSPRSVAGFAKTLGMLCDVEKKGEIGSLYADVNPAMEPRGCSSIADVETDYRAERRDRLYRLGYSLSTLSEEAQREKIDLFMPNIFPDPGTCCATLDDIDHAAADLLQAYCLV